MKKILEVKEIELDPEGGIEKIAEFFELIDRSEEVTEYYQSLGDLGRSMTYMGDSFREAYEKELRDAARYYKRDYYQVTFEERVTRSNDFIAHRDLIASTDLSEVRDLPESLKRALDEES